MLPHRASAKTKIASEFFNQTTEKKHRSYQIQNPVNMQTKLQSISHGLFLSVSAFLLTSWSLPQSTSNEPSIYTPANFEVSLDLSVNSQEQEFSVEAYIPVSDDRQQIQLVEHDPAGFEYQTVSDENGQHLQWRNKKLTGTQNIRYTFHFYGSTTNYQFPTAGMRAGQYPKSLQPYTEATPSIPSENSFIRRQANELANGSRELADLLTAYYTYVSELANEPGPAFASLFYGRKNWKNYLFMALCRAEDIPTRVVNGLEIDANGSYQVRQWTEVYVNDAWIPFNVEAQHFAFLPANILTLYRGEAPFLQYSANITLEANLSIVPREGLLGAVIR